MGYIVAQLQVPIPRGHINIGPALAVQFATCSRGVSLTTLTAFLALIAHSSNVSAASNFPCLLNKAPKFFSVVVTVVLQKERYLSFRSNFILSHYNIRRIILPHLYWLKTISETHY